MAGESKGNALLRWAVLGESGVIKSLDKVESRIKQFINKARLGDFNQNFEKALRNLSNISTQIGQKLGGAESALGRSFGAIGQKLSGLSNKFAGLFRVIGTVTAAGLGVVFVLEKVLSTLLKIGLVIKGLTFAGLGLAIKQVVKANEDFIDSMQELNAIIGERLGFQVYEIVKRERQQLKIGTREMLDYLTVMLGTQLREQVTRGGAIDENLIKQIIRFVVQVKTLAPRLASPLQLRRNIEGILAGGQEAVENFKEMFFYVPMGIIAKRTGIKEPVLRQKLMRGGVSAWETAVTTAEAFVPSKAIEAMRVTDQIRIMREAIADFLRESTQRGFFANVVKNLKEFNAELIKLLEGDVGIRLGYQINWLLDNLRKKIKIYIEDLLGKIDWARSPKENLKAVAVELQALLTQIITAAIKESIIFFVKVGIPILIKAIGEAINELTKQFFNNVIKKQAQAVLNHDFITRSSYLWGGGGKLKFDPANAIKIEVDIMHEGKKISTQTIPVYTRYLIRGLQGWF